ncbi:hypothetical protein [Nonomuraea sp. NPDC050691]|uniref:hypothetical protein n=1 Tax=Nonomuraea sp. NPDC050691 TaxID=3155661 RepID=UPI0033CD2D79
MLKRLVITAALAGSTLVVGGAATSQAASAAPKCATPSSQHVTSATATRCMWRWWHGRRCKYCWRHGAWELQWCKGNWGGGGGGGGGWWWNH